MGNSLSWESKLINQNPFKQKKAKFCCFLGLKAPLHKKYNSKLHFSQDPESCVYLLCPHTRHRANTFSNHWAKISSTLWDSHAIWIVNGIFRCASISSSNDLHWLTDIEIGNWQSYTTSVLIIEIETPASHSKWNITQNGMSLKMKCHSKWNVT